MNQETNSSFGRLLRNGGFQSFLWTQFLGALNDNLYKTFVSFRAVDIAARAGIDYLSLVLGAFLLPFLLFSGYSGHLADKMAKRSIMISVKAFEIVAMCLGLAAFLSDRIELMLVVMFLMGLHSTLFSPAKYGAVPEMLPEHDLSLANGLLEMTTFGAIVLGTSLSAFLSQMWAAEPWKQGVAMIGVAVAGFAMSFGITRTSAPKTKEPFRLNPFAEVIIGTKHLLADRPMWLTVIGLSYFWMIGALFQIDLFVFGSETLHVDKPHAGLMFTCLAIGIALGSLLAGKLSDGRVELGMVPFGAVLMGLFSVALFASRSSYVMSVIMLALLGLSSGFYAVPLNAFLQHRSGSAEKGRIMATNSFYNTVGLLIAAGSWWALRDQLGLSADKIILLTGILTLGGTVYLVHLLPDHFIRFTVRMLVWVFFRVRIVGEENVPQRGGALLVANHVSFVDGFLIGRAVAARRVRFMVWKPFFEKPVAGWFLRHLHAIPVAAEGPRGLVRALEAAREELKQGHVVCIFGEGSITRMGNLLPFKRGFEKIAAGAAAPVIPVHLDRVWGSIFSYSQGHFLSKWPKRIPYPVTVSFGTPMAPGASPQQVRQAVAELGADAVGLRKEKGDTLPAKFLRSVRRNWSRFAMADSSGKELTFGRVAVGSVLVRDWIRANTTPDQKIGLLLPASAGGAIANLGISLSGRIPVNLNFTAGKEAMGSAVEQCAIRIVVTSKVFLAKAKLEGPANVKLVFLEEMLGRASAMAKAWALVRAKFAPARFLLSPCEPDSLATVLFSSGSTSTPKGVMLSHYNILSNIEAVLQLFWLGPEDRIMGALPFFHSFGYTVTVWLPVVAGCGVIYHPNPNDAKTIGELVERYKGTFLLATPTFAQGYARKCTKAQFSSLRFVLVGAEKLREPVAQAFQEAFGVPLLEGYGATEMAPVIAVNVPNFEEGREKQIGTKAGTVGLPLPGIAARIVDPETLAPMPPKQEGLLLVKGANRMMGYLGQPEKTAEALVDGWYRTGDIAVMDDDGFLKITDRLSRFSKIAGEMVPHLRVEQAVHEVAGDEPCVVTGIPDDRKGERLALLYTTTAIAPIDLWRRLCATDLPKLWIPKQENIHQVDALPMLGTGKLDLRGVRALALQQIASSAE